MREIYYAPKLNEGAFTCPFCGVYAKQEWYELTIGQWHAFDNKLRMSRCSKCDEKSIWLRDKMIYPKHTNVPMPNDDLDENIKELYDQAKNIYIDSPRGACALLRLAIQKLCIQLGGKGKDLNADIADLVKKGLPKMVQQSLDIVRVVGNNAVHPGNIVIEDNLDMALSLFSLVNIIAEKMISEPNELQALYDKLPQNTLDQIAKRDQ